MTRVWAAGKPGSWRHPDGVSAVLDRRGQRWWRGKTRWTKDGTDWVRWYRLIEDHGPLQETN